MITRRDALLFPLAGLGTAGFRLPLAIAADDTDPTRVFTGGKKPTDARLGPPKTLNGYFPFHVPKTKEEWEARRQQVREQLLVATGLWPLPEKTPLNAVVHGRIERDGYTIEKVFFASMPGHYVSGNLYRPIDRADRSKPIKYPAILSPHGHWANGRFFEAPPAEVEKQLKTGAEKTPEGAKYPLQARCATLARMGFVVFHYDMVGYADSQAIPHRAGFTDVAAELRQQNFMGLQTWNTIRALDFLEALPDVDPKRIGVTGASGGGTQTFILCAIDDRPAAAFPAVMVSTAMQGGCICENCSYLRVNTGNVEIAGLFAPKPMAFSCADDWTKEFMTKGFPELKQLYKLIGDERDVAAKAWLQYGHNYNLHAREFMYNFFARVLLKKTEPVEEPAFKPVPPKELSVYDAEHPRPKDELPADRLRQVMTQRSDEQLAKLAPKDADSLKEFRRVVVTALRVMVGAKIPTGVAWRNASRPRDVDGVKVEVGVTGSVDGTDALPVALVTGPKAKPGACVIWVHPSGKSSLFDGTKLVRPARALTDAGFVIVAPDVLGVGEMTPEKPFPVDKNFAGYTYGYNRTLLANRVQDLLMTIGFTDIHHFARETLHLIGWGEMGPVAVLAKALAGDKVAKTAADLNQFRFEAITSTADPMMLPGAVKYGGLGAFLALCAPGEVLVHNHKGTGIGRLAEAAYAAAGAADKLTRSADKLDDDKVVAWLVK